ncbi:hypothetical protein BB561_003003 [Smittium simulii]|uniref:Uncharacterized protein n=1 Tax=Smittium simulii TaxID=133385 RepID=A0A2T9YNA2_9FUNG|nr:hypothetical protein BB561_003003 [Smittium simulii]
MLDLDTKKCIILNEILTIELETAKFMGGIRVAQTLILDGIKCSSIPILLFELISVCTEFLERQTGFE